jgi:large subunit ribosomal protein L25
MLLKCQLQTSKSYPDNTVICQVKISRAAMKAAQEAAKAAKAGPVKGKK